MWWIGRAVSSGIEPLADFYDGALAGCLNVLFLPATALLVLGFGFARQWLDGFVPVAGREGVPLDGAVSDEDAAPLLMPDEDEDWTRWGRPSPFLDIRDPRSGTLYIGNPLSSHYPGRRCP